MRGGDAERGAKHQAVQRGACERVKPGGCGVRLRDELRKGTGWRQRNPHRVGRLDHFRSALFPSYFSVTWRYTE